MKRVLPPTAAALLVALLAAAVPVAAQDGDGEKTGEASGPLLLVMGFGGTDAKLVEKVAAAIQAELGVRTEVAKERPAPTEEGARDDRRAVLLPLAEQLKIKDAEDMPIERLERKVRQGVKRVRGPQRKQILEHLDKTLVAYLSVDALIAQAKETLAERVSQPGVLGCLAVTDRPMAQGESGYVLGHADGTSLVGVITYFQLRDKNEKMFEKRTFMQAYTIAGALLGLPQCATPSCARAKADTLEEHDMKDGKVCERCRAQLKED